MATINAKQQSDGRLTVKVKQPQAAFGTYSDPTNGVAGSIGGVTGQTPIGQVGGTLGMNTNGKPFISGNVNGKEFLNQGIPGEAPVPDFSAGYKAGINHLLQKVMPMLNPETGKMLVGAGLGLIGGAGVGGLVGAADAAGMGTGGAILGGWSGSPMNPMSSPPSNFSNQYKVNLPISHLGER